MPKVRLSVYVPEPGAEAKYRFKSKGRRTGVGICYFVSLLLSANERLPKAKKMTDEAIAMQVYKEYPGRKQAEDLASGKRTVGYWRDLYNRGRLSKGVRPEKPSRRYGHDGSVVNPKSGQPLSPQDIERLEKKYGWSFQ